MTSLRQSVRLDSVARVIAGGKLALTGNSFTKTGYPAFGAGGINGFLPEHEFEDGAVILSSIGARCGKCFYPEGKWASLANTQLIFPNSDLVDRRFLWYQLNDETLWHRSGTAQPYIKPSDVRGQLVSLPPLPEQRRIASILDQADALRTKRRRALALLDEHAVSQFRSMFGEIEGLAGTAVVKKLTEVAEIKSGSTPDRKRPEFFGGGIPWVKTTEVHGDLIVGTDESVSEAGQKSARLKMFPSGSIVIAMYGQGKTRGQSAVLGIDATVNQACAVVLPSEHFKVEFMAQQLRLSYDRLRAKSQGGNQANLNLELVGGLDVFVPPISAQNEFVVRARLVDELRARQVEHLAKLDELFASLQSRAFRGEL